MNSKPMKTDDLEQVSLVNLIKKYTSGVNERDASSNPTAQQPQQKKQTVAAEKSKTASNKSLSGTSLLADLNDKMNEDDDHNDTNVNYKTKWETSEAKYRELEKKYRQLENGTVKQLQNKITQLEREAQQMKVMKDRIAEICACRQLTNYQFEQLKSLVNSDDNQFEIETIANKNDFLLQTKKLRDILQEHNEQLLSKVDQLLKKKRTRTQYENDSNDEQ